MKTKQRYPVFKEHEFFCFGREQFPDIREELHIVFKDENGAIRAGCYFGEIDLPTFDLGIIPDEIASQSPEIIQAYGENLAHQLIASERALIRERSDRIKNLSRGYEVNHHGVRICGHVKKGVDNGPRDNRMILIMTEPFEIEVEIHVRPSCFGEAMSQRETFDDDGNLTRQEIARQKEILAELYDRELRRRNRPPKHPALAHLPNARSNDDD